MTVIKDIFIFRNLKKNVTEVINICLCSRAFVSLEVSKTTTVEHSAFKALSFYWFAPPCFVVPWSYKSSVIPVVVTIRDLFFAFRTPTVAKYLHLIERSLNYWPQNRNMAPKGKMAADFGTGSKHVSWYIWFWAVSLAKRSLEEARGGVKWSNILMGEEKRSIVELPIPTE